MISIVGIRFQQDGKMLYYASGEFRPHAGEYVIAETAHGPDLGEVILGVNEVEENKAPKNLPRIIRIALPQDIQQATDIRAREKEAYVVCQHKIAEHNLEMKLVSVECTFDNSKMMFYFTANGRVDFRALVKDLASTYKTRIELRQIGVRDEARLLGGLGPCGRQICCGSFLNDFQPVSIKMAKEQSLSLNPTKISGVCGRLMCCLKYEEDQYEQVRKKMPRIGKEVNTPDGSGIVCDLNIIKETVSVKIPSGDSTEIRIYSLDQISRPGTVSSVAADQLVQEKEVISPAFANSSSEEIEISISETDANQKEIRRTKKNKGDSNGSQTNIKRNKSEESNPDKSRKADTQAVRPRNANHSRNKSVKDTKLGKPVRRENPGRESKNIEFENKKNISEGDNPIKKEAKRSSEKSKGWADALERAIHAADHE